MEEKYPNCGSILNSNGVCDYCGFQAQQAEVGRNNTVYAQPQPTVIVHNVVNNSDPGYVRMISPKHKWTAFWLCFFLGGFGLIRIRSFGKYSFRVNNVELFMNEIFGVLYDSILRHKSDFLSRQSMICYHIKKCKKNT